MNDMIHQTTSAVKNQKLFAFAVTVSIFLPYYLTGVVIAAGAAYVLWNRERRAYAMAEPHSRLIVTAVFAWTMVSLIYQNFYGVGVSLLLTCALLAAFYMRSFMTHKLFNSLMDVACLCSLSSTAVGFLQYIYLLGMDLEPRVESVCFNPNYYGMLMEFMALVALYRAFANPKRRVFYGIVMASAMLGIYFCGSISAAAVVCAGVLLFFLLRGRYKYFWTFAALGTVAAIAALTVLPIIFPRAGDADHSMDQRLSIWGTALQGIQMHPLFGQGPMTYETIYMQFNGYATHHAHNLIIDTVLNYGIVGASLIGFYAFYQLRTLITRIRRGISSSTGILLAVLAFMTLIHGMTDVTVLWLQTGMFFLVVYSSIGIRTETAVVVPSLAGQAIPAAQSARTHRS